MAREWQNEDSCFDCRTDWPHSPATQHHCHWAAVVCNPQKVVTVPLKLVEISIKYFVN